MPPFDFGKQFGRAFRQGFQAAQERQQQAKRQRALQRYRQKRLEHLAEKARKNRQLQRDKMNQGTIEVGRGNVGFLPGEGTVRMSANNFGRYRLRELQLRQQPKQPGIEVQRENVPQLPGTGPARVNPNTMLRHNGGSGGAQGGSGGSQGGGTASLPETPEAAQKQIDRLVELEQRAAEGGVNGDSLARMQSKILRLKQHRDSLRGGDPQPAPAQPDTNAAADTTRSLRSTPTSSTDTTAAADTTRGVGRSPGYVAPQELGMKTSGGNPGGGGGTPSSGGARLNPDLMGSADLNARNTESLVEDAMTVVWNRGPAEAERRLDGLVNQGYLDASKRDSVWSRVQQARREFSRRFGQQ